MNCARKQPDPPGPCTNQVVGHIGRGVQPLYCRDPVCVELRQETKRNNFAAREDEFYFADRQVLRRCRQWLASHLAITRRYFCGELVAGLFECLSPNRREEYLLSHIARAQTFMRNGEAVKARRICLTLRDQIPSRDPFNWRLRQACNDVLLYTGSELAEVGGFPYAVAKLYHGYEESVRTWYNGGHIEPARLTLALIGLAHQFSNYAGLFRSPEADLNEAATLVEAAGHFSQRSRRNDPRRDSLQTLVTAKKVQIAILTGQKPKRDAAILLREEPDLTPTLRVEALEAPALLLVGCG